MQNYRLYGTWTENEIEEFEKLIRKFLKVPISTPHEALYLELGIIPIGIIVKARRINYLHYLINRNPNEMLHKFFLIQWLIPSRGDWTETVKRDLEDRDIPCDFGFFKSKSQETIKKIVKRKTREYALKQLTSMQKSHSKMAAHYYPELKRQTYLTLKNARIDQIRNIFGFEQRWRYLVTTIEAARNLFCVLYAQIILILKH